MNKKRLLLVCILFLAFFLRLYRIDAPLADWHSWRQADTASVTREFIKNGYDLLHPRFHDLSNVPSGMDNPQGYRFVEFPIYNLIHGVSYQIFPVFSFEVWGRLVTVFSSVLSVFFIYNIVKKYFSETAALLSSFFYAVLPFSIYFGRVILPDPMMTTSFLGAIYFFLLWAERASNTKTQHTTKQENAKRFLLFSLALVLSVVSLLLKPFAAFFLLPLAFIAYQHFGILMLRKWQLYIFVLITITPLLLWRWWMLQYPEGIPSGEWLFNGGNIRFTGAFFYWIFADRIGRLILGYYGLGIFAVGLLRLSETSHIQSLKNGKSWIIFSFLLSSLFYLIVIARGNVQHDYYQIPIIPSLVMVLGIGGAYLFKPKEQYHRLLTGFIFVGFTLLTLFSSWYFIRDFFNINNPNIVSAGEAVDRLTPEDSLVVALYGGDTSFLYQTKRKGWSSLQEPLEGLIQKGAEYLVIVNPTDEDREGFGQEYETIESTDAYLLIKLDSTKQNTMLFKSEVKG